MNYQMPLFFAKIQLFSKYTKQFFNFRSYFCYLISIFSKYQIAVTFVKLIQNNKNFSFYHKYNYYFCNNKNE